MDAFAVIQHFFTRMQCRFCGVSFAPEDVRLLDEGEGYYVVSLHCHDCGQHNGDAAVGVEHQEDIPPDMLRALDAAIASGGGRIAMVTEDPELTEDDLDRLSDYEPITEKDVLNAHQFIQNLDKDWMKFIPPEMRQSHKETDTE